MPKDRLGDILIRAGLLEREGLQKALTEQRRWGGLLGHYLVELKLITEENLIRALSTQYKMPAVSIHPSKLDVEIARLVPQRICERHRLVCFRADKKKRFIDIAMANPANADAIDDVRVATQFNVRAHIAGPRVIDQAITYVFYGELPLVGGEVDLSPASPLRNAGPAVEVERRAPTLEISTRRRDVPTREVHTAQPGFLSGEVTLGDEPAKPPPLPIEPVQSAELPITVDEVDERDEGPTEPGGALLMARIERLELQLGRCQKSIAALVKLLMRKGIISPQDASDVGQAD